jgi:hypothetical protein
MTGFSDNLFQISGQKTKALSAVNAADRAFGIRVALAQ